MSELRWGKLMQQTGITTHGMNMPYSVISLSCHDLIQKL
jgi:hypothetical protein